MEKVAVALHQDISGIAYGLSDEAYFAHPALNKSTLSSFAGLEDQELEETAAMAFGSLTHCALLKPELLDMLYMRTEVGRRGTKEWAAAEEFAAGRELVKADDWDAAMLVAESVHSHNEAASLLKGAMFEVSVFWTDPETGLECKCRPDILGSELADLKTCVSARSDKFRKELFDRKYDWQDAFYCEGLNENGLAHNRMVFIAVEKKSKLLAGSLTRRHQIGLFEVSMIDRIRAREEVAEWRRIYAYSKQSGEYPEYARHIQTVERPQWINREGE